MPDFGTPVAQNVNVDPSKGVSTLSDLMSLKQKQIGIQQAQQNLQTGQFMQQQQQAEAQKQQQAMGERQTLQGFLSSGKDDQGNSILDASGQPNMPALSAAITRTMPLTGQDALQHIIKTQSDKIGLTDVTRQLGQSYRNDISGIVRSSINSKDSADDMGSKLDAYVAQQGPNAPVALAQAAGFAKSQFLNAASQPTPEKKNAEILRIAQGFQPAGTTEGEQKPSMGTITGPNGGLQAVQLNPLSPVPMGANGTEVKQGVSPQIMMDANGRPHFVGGAGGGVGNTDSWPSTTDVQARNSAAANMTTHFDGLNASAQSVPLTTALTKTIQGLAPEAFTGVGGDKKQYMAGVLRAFGANPTGDAQTDTNLLNKAIAQLNISSPAGTDAARALVEAGQPNSKMDPQAIKEAAGTIAGQVKMNQAERDFLTTTRYRNGGAGDPQAYQQGRQTFEANADPRIWQYEELANTDRGAARAFIARQPDKADLIRKAGALQGMGFFQ